MDVLRAWRRLLVAPGLAAAWLLAWPGGAGAQAGSSREYQVKAAFLYNFAKFVEWPSGAFAAPGDPVGICVVGENPFGQSLDAVVRGETLNGRRLVVHRKRNLAELRDCHILFLAEPERWRLAELSSGGRSPSALVVGEGDGFLSRGGMIRFVLEDGRVRFEINLDAAERSGLKLSSKLLRLARAVNPQRHGQGQGQGG